MKRYGILCLAALGIAGTTRAQTPGDNCRELPDTAEAVSTIASCSAALQESGKPTDYRSADYVARGKAYRRHGDYDKATADFFAAFGLTPARAAILDDAAIAYEDEDRLEAAIVLYRLEIQLQDNADFFGNGNPFSGYDLGRDEFDAGMYADAARDLADFFTTTSANPDAEASGYGPYWVRAVLWVHIARVVTGAADTDRVSVAQQSSGLDLTQWPEQIYGYFLGKVPRDTLFAAASKTGDDDALCLANYWVGEYDLAKASVAHTSTAAPLALLRKAATLCGAGTEERYGANIAVQGMR